MSLATEVAVQRKITTAFINTQPVPLVLIPRTKAAQPSGGSKWVEAEEDDWREEQTLRLVEPPSNALPIQGADGISREVEFLLLGEWDAEIGRYDIFDHDGLRWEVASLYHFNGWERRASVIRYG